MDVAEKTEHSIRLRTLYVIFMCGTFNPTNRRRQRPHKTFQFQSQWPKQIRRNSLDATYIGWLCHCFNWRLCCFSLSQKLSAYFDKHFRIGNSVTPTNYFQRTQIYTCNSFAFDGSVRPLWPNGIWHIFENRLTIWIAKFQIRLILEINRFHFTLNTFQECFFSKTITFGNDLWVRLIA